MNRRAHIRTNISHEKFKGIQADSLSLVAKETPKTFSAFLLYYVFIMAVCIFINMKYAVTGIWDGNFVIIFEQEYGYVKWLEVMVIM